MPAAPKSARRRPKQPITRRKHVGRPYRYEDVVGAIHEAALGLLERHGYEGLRYEDVARIARLNKTSVYRRYPWKVELVVAALASQHVKPDAFPPTTGDLRTDLVAQLERTAKRLRTPRGAAVARALAGLDDRPTTAKITPALRERFLGGPTRYIESAIARGDLARTTDVALAAELVHAPLYHRVVLHRRAATSAWIESVVDAVLRLLRPPRASARPETKRKARAR